MGIRTYVADRCIEWLFKNASVPAQGAITATEMGRPYHPAMDHESLIERYKSWVFACVYKNATVAAHVPIRLYVKVDPQIKQKCEQVFKTQSISQKRFRRLKKRFKFLQDTDEVEEVLSHPILDLLTSVNGQINQYELFFLGFQALELTGNAYWYLSRDKYGIPIEIWPLMPQWIEVIPDRITWVKEYRYGKGHEKVIIKPEDMIHFRYPSVKDPILGMGPLEAAAVASDLSNSMNEYETQNFQNGGTPDAILTYPAESGNIGTDERKRLYNDWRRRFNQNSLFRKRGQSSSLFIAEGGADLKAFGFSPKEMSFLQGRKWSVQEIAGIFGVPLSKLMIQEISRANAEQGDAEYLNETIKPKLRISEDKLNDNLIPIFDENLFLSYDDPVEPDAKLRLEQQKVHIETKYASINEERAIDGLEPVEWGDAPPEPPQIPLQPPNPDEDKKTKFNKPRVGVPADNFIPMKILLELRAYYESQGRKFLKSVNLEQLKAQADDISNFDWDNENKELEKIMGPYWEIVVYNAGKRAIELVSNRQFNLNAPNVLDQLARRRVNLRNINDTTVREIRRAVNDGIRAGEGPKAIRKRIREVWFKEGLEEIDERRIEIIARTETIWAHNAGIKEGWIQSGVVEAMEWSTAQDERACEWCGPLDGRIVGITGKFFDKGEMFEGREGGILNFDYDEIGHPPLHPQCRCTILPVLKEI